MNHLVIATRNGTVTAPDKSLYRLVRGRTIGDDRHPAVAAYPENWMPLEVELPFDGVESASASLTPEGAALLDEYAEALGRIARCLRDLDVVDEGVSLTADQLASLVLDRLGATVPEDEADEDDPPAGTLPSEADIEVLPPVPPRKRAPAKKA